MPNETITAQQWTTGLPRGGRLPCYLVVIYPTDEGFLAFLFEQYLSFVYKLKSAQLGPFITYIRKGSGSCARFVHSIMGPPDGPWPKLTQPPQQILAGGDPPTGPAMGPSYGSLPEVMEAVASARSSAFTAVVMAEYAGYYYPKVK